MSDVSAAVMLIDKRITVRIKMNIHLGVFEIMIRPPLYILSKKYDKLSVKYESICIVNPRMLIDVRYSVYKFSKKLIF